MKANWKKNIAIFMASQALSLFGSSLVQYAMIWHITLTTKSGAFATVSILCGFLPTLILSPFGGVWADRYRRKNLIMIADGCIALTTLLLAVLFFMGHDHIWLLFAAMGVRALGSAVQTPAIAAMLPDIVPEEHLTRVNGINGTVQSLVNLLSPMLSAALLSLADLQHIFLVDVVTAAIAIIVMLLFLQVPAQKHAEQNREAAYFAQLKEGFRYIGRHRYLLNFFIFCALFFLMAAPMAFLTPLQVARNYGDDVWRLSAIEITFSIGMMAGGLLMATWGGFKNRTRSMALGFFAMGITTAAFGFRLPFWLYMAVMGVCGLSMPLFNTPAMVLVQERVEAGVLGRVFGVFTMMSSSLMPAGMLIFGPLADILPIEWLLLGTGVVIATISLLFISNKPLLAAGEPVRREAAEASLSVSKE